MIKAHNRKDLGIFLKSENKLMIIIQKFFLVGHLSLTIQTGALLRINGGGGLYGINRDSLTYDRHKLRLSQKRKI